jgi:hypothetical protein
MHPASHPRPSALLPALALLGLALAAPTLAAAPVPVVSFEDAEGDEQGPGSYLPPTDPAYQAGDFDLRRFAVLTDGDDVLFVVTLGAAVRVPPPALQDGAAGELPVGGLSLQTVDIYLDTDHTPGAGSSACLPGRRVAFADGRTWEAAVVLTPQPELARTLAQATLGAASGRVSFPRALSIRGRTVTARVPSSALGGRPRPDWGYSVHVSGARLVMPTARTAAGAATASPDALTMPILAVAAPAAFGGAPPGEAHPRVVDVLLPAGADQGRVLGSSDAAGGAFARVPFVSGLPLDARPPAPAAPEVAALAAPVVAAPAVTAPPTSAPPPATAPAPDGPGPLLLSPNLMPRLSLGSPSQPPDAGASRSGGHRAALQVTEVSAELVTAKGSVEGLRPMQFGRVVDGQGIAVARVMVLRVLDQAVLLTVMAGKERISPGQVVLFDQPAATPGSPPGGGH